ncbi:NDP-sugar synthase [uncultured Sphaerochaeta sp.]|uniref:NDP-sugar synthase n=1 Tax=uncultured Sphaerochaeta sp. TaxID=886478 RepID=UPI002A0A5460|nr:NDP-sugar synthase [uncultured Sphaerochaeta sp.]
MKAICDFTKIPLFQTNGEPFEHPACFLPILGKPFVQHIIEYIERSGIHEVLIFLSQYADELEQLIGDGERWGISITYSLLKKTTQISERIITSEAIAEDELFLFCNSLQLPFFSKNHLLEPMRFSDEKSDKDLLWSVCTKAILIQGTTEELQETKVFSLDVCSANTYLESLHKILVRNGEGLIMMGKKIREGVWTGPGTKISPSATIVAPVYLGSQVNISSNSIVGPDCEIGNGCIIDTESSVIGSSVFAGSYIGKSLYIKGCLVNQNKILKAELDTVYAATDDLLFSSVESNLPSGTKFKAPFFSRLLALALALVTFPVYILLLLFQALAGNKPLHSVTIIPIPQKLTAETLFKPFSREIKVLRSRSETQGILLKHLLWHLIPGFWTIACGKARFFGTPWKTTEEYSHLTKDWQGLYLQSKPGIISEADILYFQYPSEEMLFASEMYYKVMDTPRYNAKLLGKYLRLLFSRRND